jgi:hypothetical protein
LNSMYHVSELLAQLRSGRLYFNIGHFEKTPERPSDFAAAAN